MCDQNKLFEALASCIGPISLPYICRLYMKLAMLPLSTFSPESRTEIIQTAVNDRFKSRFTIIQIRTLTNLIAMNMSFIRDTFLMEDLASDNLAVDIKNIAVHIFHDLILLPFMNSCIYCQKALTAYDHKLVHIIDVSKIIRAVSVMMECKSCNLIYGHSSIDSLKSRRRFITHNSFNNQKIFYLCDLFGFTTSLLYDYTCQLMNSQSPFNAFIRTVLDRINYEQSGITQSLERKLFIWQRFSNYIGFYTILFTMSLCLVLTRWLLHLTHCIVQNLSVILKILRDGGTIFSPFFGLAIECFHRENVTRTTAANVWSLMDIKSQRESFVNTKMSSIQRYMKWHQ